MNYTTKLIHSTIINIGQSIEEKMRQVSEQKEPIENVAPLMYTARKDGVLASTDIRTDRWEIAQAAMGAVNKSKAAKVKEYTELKEPTTEKNND